MNRQLLGAALLALGVPVAGCSTADGPGPATDEVRGAYDAYWSSALSAQADPTVDADLGAVATGAQLAVDTGLVAQRAEAGESVSGGYQHAVGTVVVDGDTATLVDCLTADLVVHSVVGDQPVPAGPYRVEATLVRVDGAWLVSHLVDGGSCTSASSDAGVTP